MHRTLPELESALPFIKESPKQAGRIELLVRRPDVNQREVIEEAQFDPRRGLIGDNWEHKPSRWTQDGSPYIAMQVNVMNSRVIDAISPDRSRWPLAGDQLFVDFDLSADNLPAGTRLRVGSALLEVTDRPHTGCDKFVQRFGIDATKFVNSATGRALNLRGINARVIEPGLARRGDVIAVVEAGGPSGPQDERR